MTTHEIDIQDVEYLRHGGAPLLGVKAEELTFTGGKVAGGGKSLAWAQACAALPATGLTAHGEWKSNLAAALI